MHSATLAAQRRVALARAREAGVYFLVSKPGVPLTALLPAAAIITVLSAGSGGAFPPMIPTTACLARSLLRELGRMMAQAMAGRRGHPWLL